MWTNESEQVDLCALYLGCHRFGFALPRLLVALHIVRSVPELLFAPPTHVPRIDNVRYRLELRMMDCQVSIEIPFGRRSLVAMCTCQRAYVRFEVLTT